MSWRRRLWRCGGAGHAWLSVRPSRSSSVSGGRGAIRVCGLSRRAVANLVALPCSGPIQMENPYKDPPKRCVLCGINVDYKNVQLLSQFVSPYTGSIYGRHITGLCNKKQKEITKAIKRAHVFGFMPVMFKNPQFLTDPKLCNIKYPE
uniref:Small ribosomal subunit protein bS18m n=1 Tax=Junco hyemalis TaxID=40217 RepID=A0A8C5JHN9_JUNHY